MSFVPLLHHFVPPARVGIEPDLPPTSPLSEPEPVDLDAERAEAFEEGRREAARACAGRIAEIEAQLAVVGPLVDDLARVRRSALDQAATDVAAMVIGIARKVVGDSLALHPDALPSLVRSALAELPDEDEVWIRVAPDLVDLLRPLVPERHRERVVASPEIGMGCVVETRHVSIDATVEATIESVSAASSEWLAGRR